MKTNTITQQVHFNASPQQVYDALMNAEQHAAFTGAQADIDNRVGGHFSAFEGYITGQNLELVPGHRIVQSWHAQEDYWPADHYSKVIFDLVPENEGTTLNFTHEDVPESGAGSIAEGWHTYYWQPMKEMLEG